MSETKPKQVGHLMLELGAASASERDQEASNPPPFVRLHFWDSGSGIQGVVVMIIRVHGLSSGKTCRKISYGAGLTQLYHLNISGDSLKCVFMIDLLCTLPQVVREVMVSW